MRKVDSSGRRLRAFAVVIRHDKTASRAERLVRRATDGPELGDNFDSRP